MSSNNPSVLWTVSQDLGKDDKILARSNIGIDFDTPPSPSGNTLSFVDNISMNGTSGVLTFSKSSVTVDQSPNASSTNPASGAAVASAISTAINTTLGLNHTVPEGSYFKKISVTNGVATLVDGTLDTTPTVNSKIAITSGGVYAALAGYKPIQAAKSDPSADGTTITAIATISQDTNGVITATKKTIRTGNGSNAGVLTLSSSTSSTSGESGGIAATPSAVKSAYDLANGKQDPISAGVDLKLSGTTISVNTSSTIDDSTYGFVTGSGNYLSVSNGSFVGGNNNQVFNSINSLVYGNTNELGYAASGSAVTAQSSLIVGTQNKSYSGPNFIFGINNTVKGESVDTESVPTNTFMAGRGLLWYDNTSIAAIFGQYNDPITNYEHMNETAVHVPVARITGQGINSTSRKNIEELYNNGLLWTKVGFEVSSRTEGDTLDELHVANITHHDGLNDLTLIYRKTDNNPDTYDYTFNATQKKCGLAYHRFGHTFGATGDIENVGMYTLQKKPEGPGSELITPIIEFASNTDGNAGFYLDMKRIPAWNYTSTLAKTVALSWMKLYCERNTIPDETLGDHLPSTAKDGNLALGKIAIGFYKNSYFTQSRPLIPSSKEGELTFVYCPSNATSTSFWVLDCYTSGSPATGTPREITNYVSNNEFCILMTVEPTIYTWSNDIPTMTKVGSFAVIHY